LHRKAVRDVQQMVLHAQLIDGGIDLLACLIKGFISVMCH